MKKNQKFSRFACLIFIFHTIFFASATAKKKYRYIGAGKCMACHKGALGDQYTTWRKSPHGQAYIILFHESNRMRLIKKKYKIFRPESDKRCLKCHTTGGGSIRATAREGVGCESCHGPAEKYVELANHAIGSQPRALAIKNGMWPIIGIRGIHLRERMCNRCHSRRRPCKIKGATAKEISFQVIANFPFRHPLK